MSESLSLQERYMPNGICFGCGPANDKGLRIRSFPESEDPSCEITCEWQPSSEHQAFEGVMNGGIIVRCSTVTAIGRRYGTSCAGTS